MVLHVVGMWRELALVAVCGVALACDGDQPDTESVGGTDAVATGAEATDAGGEGGEAMGCEAPLGVGACADVTICDVFVCGGKDAPFNHFGCARTSCESDSQCAETERCFAVALHTSCRAEAGACGDVDGVCACEGATSCAGVVEAHCLPTEFYPASEDCDVSEASCDELQQRLGGLAAARAAFTAAPGGQLVAQLDVCRERIEAAQQSCAEDVAP